MKQRLNTGVVVTEGGR